MDPQLLIYINKLKKYLETNRDARQYFLGKIDEDLFFQYLTDIAEKNLNTNGNPTLTMKQFELLKKTLTAKLISETNYAIEPFIHIDNREYCKIIKKI